MLAAISASENGAETILLEKNEKTGKKLYITGKGRCNLTNDAGEDAFFRNVVRNGRFLMSAWHGFDHTDIMSLVESEGTALKTERGNRVFPVSDHSSDVIRALNARLGKNGVKVLTGYEVCGLEKRGDTFLIKLRSGKTVESDTLVLATGGLSYPSTGSTGDGYGFAGSFGHRITDTSPSLVSFRTDPDEVAGLAGLTLRNVEAVLKLTPSDRKPLYKGFGEMLFTHNGLSGPLILSASAYLPSMIKENGAILSVDLKPALSSDKLDARILRDFDKMKNRSIKTVMKELLPAALIEKVLIRSGISGDKKVNSITKEERKNLVETLKALTFSVIGTGGYEEAVITRGGVDVREVDPKTMESKLVKGLFFAGEILDVDALTGGFNLQIAWSTGYTAGKAAALFGKDKKEEV